MSPENGAVLAAPGIGCCVLANNHVLDWGREGLRETLATLDRLGIPGTGAGNNQTQASAPAILPIGNASRILVFGFASGSSGVPPDWAAGAGQSGVNLLPDLTGATVAHIAGLIAATRRSGDIIIASIHWGSNWGYAIPEEHRRFAHALISEASVDLIHGHSSHHARGIEVCNGKLILYGCGDFLNDYEGIGGFEAFRGDLALLYRATLRVADGTLRRLIMVPFRIRRFRLGRASERDAGWLREAMDREAGRFGAHVSMTSDGQLELDWN
jgi:poly-gamma-glutamate synthesis protein (capsule biosynthesis protein)